MRKTFIAGNWKMNLDRAAAIALAEAIRDRAEESGHVDLAVCPPSIYLEAVAGVLSDSSVGIGGQNMYHEAEGAFTGEVSGTMLCDLGCQYVILGHSERRHILGESDEDVNKKVHAALAANLTPIVCVGELIGQREANQTRQVICQQFDGSLAGLSADQMWKIVIAYEPVWAIGTGKVASPEQAEEVHLDLRKLIKDRYNDQIADAVRIQYGGSVKPENAGELLSQPNIDGALVGGASLSADGFLGIASQSEPKSKE
ncbi:MAG: triose-phosphate isomerase [Pirellulales bacterium]